MTSSKKEAVACQEVIFSKKSNPNTGLCSITGQGVYIPVGTGIQLGGHCFPERISTPLEMAIYRISQELVSNIVKHPGAGRGRIEVYQNKDYVYTEAQDNGKGTPTEQSTDTPGQERVKGIGLESIHDRVTLLEGSIVIETTPGEGTLPSDCRLLPTATRTLLIRQLAYLLN